MANSSDILGLNQSSDSVPAIGGDAFEVEARAEQDQMKQAHQRNVALGLLAAGLATMAARPRDYRARVTPLEALGQGGLAGISAYGSAEQGTETEMRNRQMMLLDRLKFGATMKQTQELRDIQKQNAQSQAQQRIAEQAHWGNQDALTQQLRDTQAAGAKSLDQFRKDELGLRQQEIGVQASTAGSMAGLRNMEAQQFQPYPARTIKSYLQLVTDPKKITPELIDSFSQMSRSDFDKHLNMLVGLQRTGQDIKLDTVKGDDGTLHPAIIRTDKRDPNSTPQVTVLSGVTATPKAGADPTETVANQRLSRVKTLSDLYDKANPKPMSAAVSQSALNKWNAGRDAFIRSHGVNPTTGVLETPPPAGAKQPVIAKDGSTAGYKMKDGTIQWAPGHPVEGEK